MFVSASLPSTGSSSTISGLPAVLLPGLVDLTASGRFSFGAFDNGLDGDDLGDDLEEDVDDDFVDDDFEDEDELDDDFDDFDDLDEDEEDED